MAKFEWRDEQGVGHPSLVYLDVTGVPEPVTFERAITQGRIVKTRRIQSFDDLFLRSGRLDRRRVKLPGYQFVWLHCEMSSEYYAVFAAFRQLPTTRFCSEMA